MRPFLMTVALLLVLGAGRATLAEEPAAPTAPAEPTAPTAPTAPTEPTEPAEPTTPRDAGLVELVSWMTGSFSSAAQAAADPDYYDIHLHMVRIWPEQEDGYWLYVEQALGTMPQRPYRQRVYHVVAGAEKGTYESSVLELPDAKAAIGAWKEKEPLATLKPDDLEAREGCTVFLAKKPDGTYAGSTKEDACKSDFQGASYATSEVTVQKDRVVSWDRGYDADGEQVWGAVKAGYVFVKTKDHALGD